MARKSIDPLQRLIDWLKRLERRIKALETAPRLQNSSIDAGALWVLSGEGLIVGQPGGGAGSARVYGLLLVDGELRITGQLNMAGQFDVTGPWEFSGDGTISGDVDVTGKLTQTGPWELNGDGDITGDVDVTGDVGLEGNMNVTGGGKIKAGNVEIDPSLAGGAIKLGSSRRIDAGSGYLGIYDGSRFIVFNASGISLNAGGPNLIIGSSSVQLTGLPTVLKSAVPGSFTDAIVMYSGELRRVV